MVPDRLKRTIRAVVPRDVRNWLRSPSRSLDWLWDRARFSLGFTKDLHIAPDWMVRCHPHAYKVSFLAQVADPEQGAEFRNFRDHCFEGMLLFDIGAHFGMFSLAAARAGGTAIAVDPSLTATRMIAIQASLNGYATRIHAIRAAVSNRNGAISMLSSGVFSEGYYKVVGNRPKSELTEIPALTIDEMTQRFGTPSHVKIDIEGHEAAALQGGRATLAQFSPLLFLELHNEMILSEGSDPTTALNELERIGYFTFGLDGCAIDRATILKHSIARIVAKRADGATILARPRYDTGHAQRSTLRDNLEGNQSGC